MSNLSEIKTKLAQYRKWLRLSQGAVAKHIGVTKSVMSDIESNSKRGIEIGELIKLCKLFMCTPDEILGFKNEKHTESILFNTRVTNSKSFNENDYSDEEINELITFERELKNLAKEIFFSSKDVKKTQQASIPVAVNELLKDFKYTKAPINVYEIAYKLNIYVKFSVLSSLSGALIHPSSDRTAGILLNSNQPESRIRFSLAHELGHFYLNHYPDKEFAGTPIGRQTLQTERDADDFASELLMPKEFLIAEIKKLNVKEITEIEAFLLSDKFLVSYQAMLYRLRNEKYISKQKCDEFGKMKVVDIRENISSNSSEKIPFNTKIIEEIMKSDQSLTLERINKDSIRVLQERAYDKYQEKVPLDKRSSEVKSVYEDVVLWLVREKEKTLNIVDYLKSKDFEVVDKRPSGGCLWVVDDPRFQDLLNELEGRGFDFKLTMNGSKATKNKPGWYTT